MRTPLLLMTLSVVAIVSYPFLNGVGNAEEKNWLETKVFETNPPIEIFENTYPICEEISEPNRAIALEEKNFIEKVPFETMVEEIVETWNIFFQIASVSKKDKRRKHFKKYAENLASSVIHFQENETDIGGRLPYHKNTHLIIATMITFESSIDSMVIGSRNEVGLMQIHGMVLAGIKQQMVQTTPKLGIHLGVRWLASRIPKCYPDEIKDEDWTDENWLGPLSAYGNGKAQKKDGTCSIYKVSRKRVRSMKIYRSFIDSKRFSDTI